MDNAEQVCSTLSDLLDVQVPVEFFDSYYGIRPCHLRSRSKRSPPFGWDDLNKILRSHRLLPPRIRLAHSRPEALADINLHSWVGSRSQTGTPSLRRTALHAALARGATLIIDSVEELSESLRELGLGLSGALREPVGVNCYASFKEDGSFGAHWDEHDVFALQLSGRKHWKLFSATTYEITSSTAARNKSCIQPSEDLILEEGDVLYIPRGHWHQVAGTGQPSLHISVGISRKRAIDILRVLVDQIADDPFWESTIPRFVGPDRIRAFEKELENAFAEFRKQRLSLDRFLSDWDLNLRIPLTTNLPWAVIGSEAIHDDILIMWRANTARLRREPEGATFIHINGTELELPSVGKDVVELLSASPMRFGELANRVQCRDHAELKEVIKMLSKQGLVELSCSKGD